MSRASYSISVGGNDVTAMFNPVLISLSITDGDGGKADTLDIELDDRDGQIALPAPGSAIEAMLWWEEPPPWASGAAAQFIGTTDEPKSKGSRSEGRILSISAKSADLKGKGKHKNSKHKDQAKFGDVAQEWGQAAGYQVSVDSSLASVQRDFWLMANESFLSWGRRIAHEIGATFKTAHPKAVFVPRNSGASASGGALSGVSAVWGQNLISWEVAPKLSRGLYANAKTRWYDHTKAQWNEESTPIGAQGAEADIRETFKAASQDRAKNRADANADDSARKQGTGTVTIDGDAAAQAQAMLTIVGARAGVDGDYRIKQSTQQYSREQGWTTSCEIEQPQGAAGSDKR